MQSLFSIHFSGPFFSRWFEGLSGTRKSHFTKKLTEGRLRKLLKHGLFLGRVY